MSEEYLSELKRQVAEETAKRESLTAFVKVIGTLVLFCLAVAWLFYTFWYAPSHKASGPPSPKTSYKERLRDSIRAPEEAVLLALYVELPLSNPRLEFIQGNNLNIYLTHEEFRIIPYPDRADAVKRVGEAWCSKIEGIFLPTVRIRDIDTGKEFAKYSCTTGSVTINDP